MNSLHIYIPAGEAQMSPPLSVMLGQYRFPGSKVCRDFNAQTSDLFLEGVPVAVVVSPDRKDEFQLTVKKPSLAFLLSQLSLEVVVGVTVKDVKIIRRSITMESLFDVYRLWDTSTEGLPKLKLILSTAAAAKIDVQLGSFYLQRGCISF